MIEKGIFGKADSKDVELFVLKNKSSVEAKLTSFGATLVSLKTPDKNGNYADIILGYDDLDGYINDTYYHGCTVGRVANRISNAKFTLDGKQYNLFANNGVHHLHGGKIGYNKVVWNAQPFENKTESGVIFTYKSPDGDQGYPGNLDITVTYTLTDADELKIDYKASTDKKTVINLTNHSYFNLAGHNGGEIYAHQIQLNSDTVTETDDLLIPTGKLKPVKATPYDFTTPKPFGQDIAKLQMGYDVNYVLRKASSELSFAAKVYEPNSGRVMEISTTEPAIQFYTGNFLDGAKGKAGAAYNRHTAFCLETQHYPDSPNRPEFPSIVLNPGEIYKHLTVHKFSIE